MTATTHTTHIEELFIRQQQNLQQLKETDLKQRLEKIRRIEAFLQEEENESALAAALYADLRKAREEAILTELAPVLVSLSHLLSHLGDWMKDKAVSTPMAMAGISSHIRYEPKGQCLIIAPWNYPFQLAINPLLYAIAAGNAVILKPSEVSAHTSAFLKHMLETLFPTEEVAVVEGDAAVANELLAQPFNHIFFTGSPAVGKIVMKAAAEHLASVTLELGGKSPVVIDGTRDLRIAAEQIAWAKCVNNGQACIAPDYLILPEPLRDEFVEAFEAAVQQMYDPTGKGIQQASAYSRMINGRHFLRVKNLIADATAKGAHIAAGGAMDEADLFIEPTLLTDVTEDMAIMKEEIFGPVLPILTYTELTEVPAIINRRPKPLALYLQSNRQPNVEYLLQHTSAGGTAINELMVTSINPHLPFGGVNNSGIGKTNGLHGFIEFSNERGVLKRNWGTYSLIYPPFNGKIIDLLKWITRM